MKSLDKVFTIIELLKKNKEMRLQEIANELGIYKSTIHRLISELCTYNYVERDNITKKYRLGLKFLDIASYIISNLDIREAAREGIEAINNITKETVHLAILLDDKAIYIDKKESHHSIRMYSQIGKPAPLYCTGVGKAILAYQPPEILNNLLKTITFHKYTKSTIMSRKQLLTEIDEIKINGYALDNEEHEENIGCIAVPIRDYTKKVIASISVTAILYRMKLEDLLKYKDIILEKSYEISKKLGYRENG